MFLFRKEDKLNHFDLSHLRQCIINYIKTAVISCDNADISKQNSIINVRSTWAQIFFFYFCRLKLKYLTVIFNRINDQFNEKQLSQRKNKFPALFELPMFIFFLLILERSRQSFHSVRFYTEMNTQSKSMYQSH